LLLYLYNRCHRLKLLHFTRCPRTAASPLQPLLHHLKLLHFTRCLATSTAAALLEDARSAPHTSHRHLHLAATRLPADTLA
jgi:hypothetical protein